MVYQPDKIYQRISIVKRVWRITSFSDRYKTVDSFAPITELLNVIIYLFYTYSESDVYRFVR